MRQQLSSQEKIFHEEPAKEALRVEYQTILDEMKSRYPETETGETVDLPMEDFNRYKTALEWLDGEGMLEEQAFADDKVSFRFEGRQFLKRPLMEGG